MYRGTTPTYTLTLPETVDLTMASEVHVSFSDNNKEILRKTGNDLEITAHSVSVYLTQEETLSFPNGNVQIQLNWIYTDRGKRKRACSEKAVIKANKNLIDEVL